MRVMVMVKATKNSEAGHMPSEELMTAMGQFNEELVKAGIMLAGEGLHPSSKGKRIRFSGGKRTVLDGPFAETKELVAGFWLWQVRSMDEAVEWARRCPDPMPGEESERFRANIDVAAGLAESLGCKALNALYGNRVEGVDPAEQDALALENLVLAARAADRIGAVLLIEALNKPESPLYPLVSAAAAVGIVDKVNQATGLDNARFLMDLYHLSMNGEDLLAVIEQYAARTGHVQIADNPGRGAPGTGALPLEDLLDQLAKAGYDGWVGLEYKPGDRPSAESFDWLRR